MPEHILFLTGSLARKRLERVLAELRPDEFSHEIRDIGVKVAALMTEALLRRRLPRPLEADRVILPGRCRGDLAALSAEFETRFERGPDDLQDLPEFFGRKGREPDLSRHAVRIFAEIVDAPTLKVEGILSRAQDYARAGADVIDLGCLPDTPFPHLEDAVSALVEAGCQVSVDSADVEELRRGGLAGAHFLLSLSDKNCWLTEEVDAMPVLVPSAHGSLDSLLEVMEMLDGWGKPYLADPILDPIHFGFTDSLMRYAELRRRRPDVEILMGTGNLTELTDADTTGVTAVLMGMVSELRISNVLLVQVSRHCRRNLQETDAARRIMFAAREDGSLPQGYGAALMGLRDRKPFPSNPAEIAEMAALIRDPSFRIEVAEDGIHAYNRDGHRVATDPFTLYPDLKVEADGGHAFYLGYELARAQIAWQLGKRFVQDEPLDWGCAVDRREEDLLHLKQAGETLRSRGGNR